MGSITSLIFIVILAFFAWRGYQKGFIGAITRVLSFLIAYPAAIFLTKPFAHIVRAYTGLDGLILFLVVGCTIFLITSFLVSFLLSSMARLVPSNQFTDTSSKLGGTVFGLIFGGVIGLVVVYVIDIVIQPAAKTAQVANQSETESARTKAQRDQEAESIKQYVVDGGAPPAPNPVDTRTSFIDRTAKKLVSTAASTAVGIITSDKTSTQITKTLTQDPQTMLGHVQNMTNNDEFKQLLNNPEFQAEMDQGNVQSLMQNRDFQELIQNPDMQAIIASAGDAESGTSAEQAAAEKMLLAWQKVSTLKNDPRVLEIVSDPAFQAQLNSNNKLSLLMNPKMRELSEIIFSNDAGIDSRYPARSTAVKPKKYYVVEDITDGVQQNRAPEANPTLDKKKEIQEEKLYRWTDEDGSVHYSDKPIKH